MTKSGSGTVTSSPAGIDCGSTCSALFAGGTRVSLAATAAPGFTFSGWNRLLPRLLPTSAPASRRRPIQDRREDTQAPHSFILTFVSSDARLRGGYSGNIVADLFGKQDGFEGLETPTNGGRILVLTEEGAELHTFYGADSPSSRS